MNQNDFFKRSLPKWPQLNLTGQPVSVDRAKEIISRTDSFLVDVSSWAGGNNRDWDKWAFETLGYKPLFDYGDHPDYYDVIDDLRKDLQFVRTEYVHNSWLSCSFIFGPHGWCSPAGTFRFDDNIGKWPDVETVYEDFRAIAIAFPDVKMTATLMDRESGEENKTPVVTFLIDQGRVTMTDEHDQHHFKIDEQPVKTFDYPNPRREQGVPDSWIVEFGAKFKPSIEKALAKLK